MIAAQPLVTIVTPCLQAAERIERCIASVAAQTYARVEHIVVDGGSDDGTVELLAEATGVRWISAPDRGQSDAINKGFALATGDLLTWLNADDELMPDTAEAVVAAFRRRPEAGWAYGDCLIRSSAGEGVRHGSPAVWPGAFDFGNVIPQPGCFVARWALELVGPLDESFELAMDYDLWLRLADAAVPAAYLPRVLAVFEVAEGTKTMKASGVDWARDEARALVKAGKPRAAAAAFGRWAARDALLEQGVLSRAALRPVIAGGIDEAEACLVAPSRLAVRAGATTEAALGGLGVSRRALLLLAAPSPWLVSVTRRPIARWLRDALFRRLRARGDSG